jgi:hypothetical protein
MTQLGLPGIGLNPTGMLHLVVKQASRISETQESCKRDERYRFDGKEICEYGPRLPQARMKSAEP